MRTWFRNIIQTQTTITTAIQATREHKRTTDSRWKRAHRFGQARTSQMVHRYEENVNKVRLYELNKQTIHIERTDFSKKGD